MWLASPNVACSDENDNINNLKKGAVSIANMNPGSIC